VDYILFIQRDVQLDINPNEVAEYKYVNQEQLKTLLRDSLESSLSITPWFKLICETFLFDWWSSLDNLSTKIDQDTIHKL
jgi:isopentenyl-diphosphate delta-isomerase